MAAVCVLSCRTADPRQALFESPEAPRELRTAEFRASTVEAAVARAKALERNATNHVDAIGPIPFGGAALWWPERVKGDLEPEREDAPLPLRSFIERAIGHSTQIRVFSEIPLIRETGVAEARGAFTPRAFAEGKYEYRNEPVGSLLTTGNPGRFRQNSWTFDYGLRKRLRTGAELELAHRFASLASNSIFFVPDPQTTSRLSVSLVQPLLRGGGLAYNDSVRDLARVDAEVARYEFVRQVESHLLEITRSYWNLYLARAIYLQRERLVDETRAIVARLEKRAGLDAGRVQLIRSDAALRQREADLVRARISIENGANRLRALVNDPEIERRGMVELIPVDAPIAGYGTVDLGTVISEAVQRRPEVQQAYLQYEAAAIRHGVARNENRWMLDLVIEASSNGIDDGKFRVGPALTNGFDFNPSLIAGLRFEAPIGPDQARARLSRRALELRQQQSQVRTTLNTAVFEAQVSVAEYASAVAELERRQAAVQSASESLKTLRSRWEQGLGAAAGVDMLEHLLDAQELLTGSEEDFVNAQISHMIAIANLERAKGNFLGYQRLEAIRVRKDGEKLPSIELEETS